MNCTPEMLRLYAVTDRAWVGRQTLPQQVESALKGGATCVQLREKNLGDAAILAEALEIAALCRNYGVPFILNDNVTLAARCGADGVHLGQEDMDPAEARRILGPDKIIGYRPTMWPKPKPPRPPEPIIWAAVPCLPLPPRPTPPRCPRRR